MNRANSAKSGVTLPELLCVLTLIAVLATAAVPSFSNLILNQRLASAVNHLVHGIHLAKRSAYQFVADIVLCKSSDGRQCDHPAGWESGWIVYVNEDRDRPPRVDPGERVIEVGRAFAPGTVSANRPFFVFRPFEIRSTNGTLVFCDRRGAGEARAVVVSYTGRPRAARRGPGNAPLDCPT